MVCVLKLQVEIRKLLKHGNTVVSIIIGTQLKIRYGWNLGRKPQFSLGVPKLLIFP